MVEAAVELIVAFEQADATLDAGVETAAAAEPGLMFVGAAFGRLMTGLGQDDALNLMAGGIGFIVGRVEATVATGLVRGFAKQLAMVV